MLVAVPVPPIVPLIAALALPGPDGSRTAPPRPAEPIHGGVAVAPGAWPAVVGIYLNGYLCTGTLVSPTIVLTAAHCIGRATSIDSVFVRRGEDLLFPGPSIAVVGYAADPAYCWDAGCKEDVHDYAYIELAAPQTDLAEFPRPVADQAEWDELMRKDRPVTVVGYGEDEHQVSNLKREVEVPISRFSGSGLEFVAGGMGHDSCQGDSGGPAFAQLESGEWRIVGVTSRGYTCGDGGIYGAPIGGLCWLHAQTGLDLRPPNCDQCDCIDTDPNRDRGCDCDAAPNAADALALLPLLGLLLRRRRAQAAGASRVYSKR